MPERDGHHICRHALCFAKLGAAPQAFNQGLTGLLAVQQQRRVLAASAGVGGQKGFDAHAQLVRTRVAVAERATRANRGAGAATDTQIGVDNDALTIFFAVDGLGRADFYTGIAAHGFVAAVRTNLLLVIEELGLFKLADLLTQRQQCGQILALPLKVALRQGMPAESRLRAHVQHQIELVQVLCCLPLKVNRTGDLAGRHASAVRLAGQHVDLIVQPDGVFGTGSNAGIATRA